MFAQELEKASSLVLPNCCEPARCYDNLLTIRIASESLKKIRSARLVQFRKLVTVRVAEVALFRIRSPSTAGQHVTFVLFVLDGHIILNTMQLALGQICCSTTGHRPCVWHSAPVLGGHQEARIADQQSAPLKAPSSALSLTPDSHGEGRIAASAL